MKCKMIEKSYNAYFYLRILCANSVTVKLLCAKSRVVFMKRLTIPRLELYSSLLAVRMVAKVKISLTMAINNIYYW